jgi:hypothetical protein
VWRFQKLLVFDLPDPATVPSLIKKDDWKVMSCDSAAAPRYAAQLAIDGNAQSFWHTQFQPTDLPYPHEIVVDMGAESILHSFEFLPRQGAVQPRIKDFELFVSTDGKTWGAPLIKDIFKDSEDLQSYAIDKARARYFKLVGLTGYTRDAASVAEISFYATAAE